MGGNKKQLFTELYYNYSAKILKLCLGYTADHALAQDLVQETFARAWESIDKFRGESKASTWLYRIAVNTCLGHLRSPKNKNNSGLSEKILDEKAEEKSDIENQVQLLYKCINQLAETDRIIISMVLEDLPYAEIAETIGITEGNLRVKIHRIKQQLSDIYNSYERL
jgi:RNA polymerase sigma factor (sigma-70 family)